MQARNRGNFPRLLRHGYDRDEEKTQGKDNEKPAGTMLHGGPLALTYRIC
jgi:hypothetical protein